MDLTALSDAKRSILAASVFFLLYFFLMFVKRIFWKRIDRYLAGSTRGWDRDLLTQLHRPVHALLFLLAMALGFECLPERFHGHPTALILSKALFILSFASIVNTVLTVAIRHWHAGGNIGESARALVTTLFRIALIALTLLIILDTAGISITPILASLGVGSVAVALALQDTLGNFFSGIHILIDKPIRVGDFVRLDKDTEGVVKEIGWRSTHIQLPSNNTVVIPNSKLSSSIITNFNLPVEETSVILRAGVAYGSDLEKVERIAIAVGTEVATRMPGAVSTFTPLVRFEELAASSINFMLIVRAKQYLDSTLIRHELIKELHARFAREEISIPFPQRVVHLAESARIGLGEK